ncbi:hypothetical protein V6N12_042944 [Hibiscus sabdariffa]|uniref:Uncharacterized protein n=1 Tax=Hibiscus sabdariffa TaxID=183260 RepID=A0ABR2AWX9_9ROSI
MVVPVWVLSPTLGIGLDFTSLARLCLEYFMLFWELCLRFVQHRITLLPDAPNDVVSIGVVSLLPCTAGRDRVVRYDCSIARLATTVHVHWPAFGVGLGLNISARLWPESCNSFIALTWRTSLPLWAGFYGQSPTAASGSPSEGLPTEVASAVALHPASDSVAASLAPADRLVSSAPTSSVQAIAVTKDVPHDPMVQTNTSDMLEEAIEDASLVLENSATATDWLASEDVPYDPMVHNDTSDMLEEVLEISSDCVLLANLAGVI